MSLDFMYLVSEVFTSPQGEGIHTGTLMTFVRLPGCNVGRPFPKETYNAFTEDPSGGLPIYIEQCQTWDGRKFACDTDYRSRYKASAEGIILAGVPTGVEHLCVTGGEPLLWDLAHLFEAWKKYIEHYKLPHKHSFHIETSGTKPIPMWMRDSFKEWIWVTCSPKVGACLATLLQANELKFLVDKDLDVKQIEHFEQHFNGDELVWLQPINGEHTINDENMKLCLEIQKQHPRWRISSQQHKLWGVR